MGSTVDVPVTERRDSAKQLEKIRRAINANQPIVATSDGSLQVGKPDDMGETALAIPAAKFAGHQ